MATRTTTPTSAPRTSTPSDGDAIALLKADHRNVESLFAKFDGVGERAHKTREAAVKKIIESLSRHAVIEESVFYPAVRQRIEDANATVLEALEEHHLVKVTLAELEKMGSADERYTAKVTVLKEHVEHHVEEEEKDLFPKVRKAFTKAELNDLGEQLAAAKKGAPTRPHPGAPDTPPGNIIAAAVSAPLDAAVDLAGRAVDAVRDRLP